MTQDLNNLFSFTKLSKCTWNLHNNTFFFITTRSGTIVPSSGNFS